MTKVGRNDPCHCGSGKKYKKCCANEDQLKTLEQVNKSITSSGAANDLSWNDDINKLSDENPYPPISNEEEKLVDDWWSVYRKIESLEEIRNHLDTFMHRYPQLVENLGLEHEVLFELGADYRRQERTDEYILFLRDFRNRFPSTFARSAGYYDSDIIAWLISKGRAREIKDYLNYFIENPVKFIDQLYQIIYLLLATDTTDEIIALVTQVAEPIVDSDKIIFGDDIVHLIGINVLSGYIKNDDFTKEDATQFISDLRKIMPYQLKEDKNIVDLWVKKLKAITRPFDQWENDVPEESEKLNLLYKEIILNFMRYIFDEANISWMSAQYYADLAYDFLTVHEDKVKSSKRLFDFSKKNIENRLATLTRQMVIYVDCTKFMSLLNAIHFFAGYLRECNNFTTAETETVQQSCKNIYFQYYPMLEKEYFEAICLKQFPFFRGQGDL